MAPFQLLDQRLPAGLGTKFFIDSAPSEVCAKLAGKWTFGVVAGCDRITLPR